MNSNNQKIYFNFVSQIKSTPQVHLIDHNYHAFHHNFTTKTPHLCTTFSKTPLKNARKTHKKAPATAEAFF
jgi:hypothetical protein